MEIGMKIELVRDIVDHYMQNIEEKLDNINVTLASEDVDAVTDMLLGIIEDDLLNY